MNDSEIELKPSEIISAFLKLIDTSTKNYSVAQEYVDEYDREEADLVHKCELQGKGMKQNEKSKNYTMLCNNRNARRYWKDIVDMGAVLAYLGYEIEYSAGDSIFAHW